MKKGLFVAKSPSREGRNSVFSVWGFLCTLLLLAASAWANSAPVVSNVTVSQRIDGNGIVDIYYWLSDADGDDCTVSVEVSNDGGSSWTITPSPSALSGAIGTVTPSPGAKHIHWSSQTDLPGEYGTNYRIRITADDSSLALIPGGTFSMGDSFNGRPVHTVTLDAFTMGKYEITNAQYRDFLNATLGSSSIYVSSGEVTGSGNNQPYCDTSTSSSDSQIAHSGGVFSVRTKGGRNMVNDPMVRVTWYGAVAYCNWRSGQEGLASCYNLSTWTCDFSKNGYHLPTEAQWEYAARGGLSGRRFPWGDTITHSQANYYSSSNYSYDISPTRGYHPTWNDGIEPYTASVGSFSPNGYGLYDMAGNVWEWCNDWYGSYSSGSQTNPTGPTSGSYRIIRGGGWSHPAHNCWVAYRDTHNLPSYHSISTGFRLCR